MNRKHSSVFSHELVTVSVRPYNAETPLPALLKEITPSELVYVRNHFEVPELEVSEWTLKVTGSVREPRSISHSDLRTLPSKTLRMTLECAGNGRRAMDPVPAGTPWGYGAVSIVEFTGTPVSNVLELAGISDEAVEAVFHGADRGEVAPGRMEPYVRSLPLEVALSPDTILAWEMNGEPLTTDHGFPLRMVVPGWYGMASVKWLTSVRVLEKPFVGFFQTERYIMADDAGVEAGISQMAVQSFVSWPEHDTSLPAGQPVAISGMAWSGSGPIRRVDVSMDDGATWQDAHMDESPIGYSWQEWHVDWTPEKPGHYTIIARAVDEDGNLQPLENRWNPLGYCINGVKPVCVTAV